MTMCCFTVWSLVAEVLRGGLTEKWGQKNEDKATRCFANTKTSITDDLQGLHFFCQLPFKRIHKVARSRRRISIEVKVLKRLTLQPDAPLDEFRVGCEEGIEIGFERRIHHPIG